ncbi:hypothetical protein IE53DRAFT_82156 [Violaceomyces palustris]|uniref:Uncharacterized protein n=1 Tax=Violaceomyces palustris TaxID=1673888 RepID=A0ACD0NY13_9BASI|nr:hypothetical protein IE53DRAFT_82156 [Violaceomyces palustris]
MTGAADAHRARKPFLHLFAERERMAGREETKCENPHSKYKLFFPDQILTEASLSPARLWSPAFFVFVSTVCVCVCFILLFQCRRDSRAAVQLPKPCSRST